LRGVAPAEANGDSRSTMEFIGLVVPVQENFCPALADLINPIQNIIFLYLTSFVLIYFLLLFEIKFTEYFTDKKPKRSHSPDSRNPGFFYYFRLMMGGSGSGSGSGSESGTLPLTNGFGSGSRKS
jgi:hypothetical protein